MKQVKVGIIGLVFMGETHQCIYTGMKHATIRNTISL